MNMNIKEIDKTLEYIRSKQPLGLFWMRDRLEESLVELRKHKRKHSRMKKAGTLFELYRQVYDG